MQPYVSLTSILLSITLPAVNGQQSGCDGQWSDWSDWSGCSFIFLPLVGYKMRIRYVFHLFSKVFMHLWLTVSHTVSFTEPVLRHLLNAFHRSTLASKFACHNLKHSSNTLWNKTPRNVTSEILLSKYFSTKRWWQNNFL